MQPMGRKHYKCNTDSKHSIKNAGRAYSWWQDICQPSKKRERQQVRRDIMAVTDTDD